MQMIQNEKNTKASAIMRYRLTERICRELCDAIVVQAAADWREAARILRKSRRADRARRNLPQRRLKQRPRNDPGMRSPTRRPRNDPGTRSPTRRPRYGSSPRTSKQNPQQQREMAKAQQQNSRVDDASRKIYPNQRVEDAQRMKRECEEFFRSEWMEMLTGVPGELILKKLQEEAEQNE